MHCDPTTGQIALYIAGGFFAAIAGMTGGFIWWCFRERR